jgi:hypothetical protein
MTTVGDNVRTVWVFDAAGTCNYRQGLECMESRTRNVASGSISIQMKTSFDTRFTCAIEVAATLIECYNYECKIMKLPLEQRM